MQYHCTTLGLRKVCSGVSAVLHVTIVNLWNSSTFNASSASEISVD